MKYDFNEIEKVRIPQFKNGEGDTVAQMIFDGAVRILRGRLEPGCSIGYHKHETNSETIYIVSGKGKVLYDDTEESLHKGDCHYCPKGHSHSLINNSTDNLEFFAVVPEHNIV